MKLAQYLAKKKKPSPQPPRRVQCSRCLQPKSWCYCADIDPFDCSICFVILLHPLERRRRIATGRMSHLLLKNSQMIQGYKYSGDEKVNALIRDPKYHCMVLCIGDKAIHIDRLSLEEKKEICPEGKRLLVFVVDGTWSTASKTIRLSDNLKDLPRICFSPDKPSNFRVRQQPNERCYSTIEAIHQTIELLGPSQGFNIQTRRHDRLLSVFDGFVTKQVNLMRRLKEQNGLQRRKIRR